MVVVTDGDFGDSWDGWHHRETPTVLGGETVIYLFLTAMNYKLGNLQFYLRRTHYLNSNLYLRDFFRFVKK